MRHIACVLLAVALSTVSALAQASSNKRLTVPSSVAKLIVPILDAVEETHNGPRPMKEGKGSPLWRTGELMGKLFDDKSAASNEALVALLYYYLGEANAGDQLQEIICRGKRMLPYLRKYGSLSPEIPRRHYSHEILLAPETVSENFRDVTDQINKGHSASACQSRP